MSVAFVGDRIRAGFLAGHPGSGSVRLCINSLYFIFKTSGIVDCSEAASGILPCSNWSIRQFPYMLNTSTTLSGAVSRRSSKLASWNPYMSLNAFFHLSVTSRSFYFKMRK